MRILNENLLENIKLFINSTCKDGILSSQITYL